MKFHAEDVQTVFTHLETDNSGLDSAAVAERLKKYGYNEIPEGKKVSWVWLLVKQFKSVLILILILAAIISGVSGHIVDVYVIVAVILINALIGFIQEMRAENAVASLKKMIVTKARVLRDGTSHIIPARELVPGDIIILEEGDSIPADARLIESKNLRTIEASLTGESVPTGKVTDRMPENAVMADQKNMIWKGTFVAGGFAKAIVCGTGMNTAIGDIAKTLTSIKAVRTNFQKKSDKLGRQMGLIAVASCILLFLVGYFSGNYETEELLLVSIAALVSAIPEGLPAVLSIVLAIGSHRMARRNAIIREFTSVETLGAVTTIITDKTGTLTQNKLTAQRVMVFGEPDIEVSGEGWIPLGNFTQIDKVLEPDEHPAIRQLLRIAAFSNNSTIKHNTEKDTYELLGDPTEGALLVMAKKGGTDPTHLEASKIDDIPFSSATKYRATLFDAGEDREILVVGAPEQIIQLCTAAQTRHGNKELDEVSATEIRAKIDEWSGDAMRVIGLAYKKVSKDKSNLAEEDVNDLVFAGVVGMIDPPRPDVKTSVEHCIKAGIRVIMATGDHINTALSIARATSIVENLGQTVQALTEHQLSQLDEREFDEAIRTVNVFARLTPRMKLRIAERLQAMGELVAMTGDGVNDAPALKKADVGVAMGIMGTDVARDASKVVLADDNFSTIVNAVEEGRIVFTNARQTSFFLLTTNFAEILTLASVVALGYPIALTATQILWLNLVTDGFVDKALAAEHGHGDSLTEKPVKKDENILNKEVIPFLLIMSVLMTCLSLAVYFYYLEGNEENINKARTGVFIIMAFTQLFNVFNMRSLKQSIFTIGVFSNKYINIAVLISVIIQVVLIETPFFERVFKFEYVSLKDFLTLAALSSTVLMAGELYKFFRKRVRSQPL
jgi:P-type Ca2+ transporter type 2C